MNRNSLSVIKNVLDHLLALIGREPSSDNDELDVAAGEARCQLFY